MIGDPYLNYFALGILFFVVIVLFYGVIAIHDIPHLIAKSRQHPHQDAIHAAGWVSLFTPPGDRAASDSELESLRSRLAALEARLPGIRPESGAASKSEQTRAGTRAAELEIMRGER
jgi:hypothetical protein